MDQEFFSKLKLYGVGRRRIDDELFANDKPVPRIGLYDLDEEALCHKLEPIQCSVPHCAFKCESILEYEHHYNALHRYSCSQCKKMLPSAHLLDLHLQEQHDSFFAVMALKKASYCCYLQECEEKFMTSDARRNHCIEKHKFPKDFSFDRPKLSKKKRFSKTVNKKNSRKDVEMETSDSFNSLTKDLEESLPTT